MHKADVAVFPTLGHRDKISASTSLRFGLGAEHPQDQPFAPLRGLRFARRLTCFEGARRAGAPNGFAAQEKPRQSHCFRR